MLSSELRLETFRVQLADLWAVNKPLPEALPMPAENFIVQMGYALARAR